MFPNGYFGTYFLDDFFPPVGDGTVVVVPPEPDPEPIPTPTFIGGTWVGRWRRWRRPPSPDEVRKKARLELQRRRKRRRRDDEEIVAEITGRLS